MVYWRKKRTALVSLHLPHAVITPAQVTSGRKRKREREAETETETDTHGQTETNR